MNEMFDNAENKACFIQFNSDIAKDSTDIRIAFYANIGFFIEVAQMFEFNLRKLICYERSVKDIEASEISLENVKSICIKYDEYYDTTYFNKYTLGKLIEEVKKYCNLEKGFIDIIREINSFRKSIVHFIFQNNVSLRTFESSSTVADYINMRLIPMTNKAVEINKTVIKIMNVYKEDLHMYKTQVGLPIPN